MPKYAIRIREQSLDLLGLLNGGVKPAVEDRITFLIVDTDNPDVPNTIEFEDDLYENGYTKDPNLIWM